MQDDGDNLPIHDFDLWTRANAGEVLPGVICPLTWSSLAPALDDNFRSTLREAGFRDAEEVRFCTRFHGRVYFNIGAMHHYMVEKEGLPSAPLLSTFGGPDQSQGLPLPDRPLRWRRLLRYLPVYLKSGRRQRRAPKAFAKAVPLMEAMARELAAIDPGALADEELGRVLAGRQDRFEPFMEVFNDCMGASFASYGTLAFAAEKWCGDRSLANDLVVGLAFTKTAEVSADLWRIARLASDTPGVVELLEPAEPGAVLGTLRADPRGSAVAAELDGFLERYGHRCADEFNLTTPRWAEDPSTIMGIFRSYVLKPPPASPSQVTQRQQRTREEATRRARAILRSGFWSKLFPWRWLLFRSYIRQAQLFTPLRENPKFYLLKLMLPQRRMLLELGRRLSAQGLLEVQEDIFFLTTEELLSLNEEGWSAARPFRDRVAARRRDHERWQTEEPPPILRGDGTPVEDGQAAAPEDAEVLRGLGASSGRVSGQARVITTIEQGHLMREGEILVAPFTDPGWTPLFPLARAIVTDLGGLLSHGALVAREYGVPAVVNTRDGTRLIRTGDTITVDGNEGLVIRHDSTGD